MNRNCKVHNLTEEALAYKPEDHYYPFGMQMPMLNYQSANTTSNKYKYNGKLKRSGNPDQSGELQDDAFDTDGNSITDTKLDWYDYEARMYDAALGRWHVVDPMAEQTYSNTPYHYGLNNPIIFIDPDGRFATVYIIGHDEEANEKAFNQLQASTKLKLKRDKETGQVTTESKADTKGDQLLLDAIKDPDIEVNVITVKGAVYGEFYGSKYSNGKVRTKQLINPEYSAELDEYGYSGQTIKHETTESYIGGKVGLALKRDIGRAERKVSFDGKTSFSKDYDIYDYAHKDATDPVFKNDVPSGIDSGIRKKIKAKQEFSKFMKNEFRF